MKRCLIVILSLMILVCASCTKDGNEIICSISVSCRQAIESEALDEDILKILTENGVMLISENVKAYSNESVFELLQREAKKQKLALAFSGSGALKTAYIQSIGGLSEFDCGPSSGWIFTVNGEYLNKGCSQILLSDGDKIEFIYSVSSNEIIQ